MSERMTLDPCPFCGGESWVVDVPDTRRFRPQCKKCGANLGEFDRRSDAVTSWNTRAHLSQPAQAVDVAAIKRVVNAMRDLHPTFKSSNHDDWVKTLTRALSGEKAGRVGGYRFSLNDRVQFNNGKHVFSGTVDRIEWPHTIYHVQLDDGTRYECYGYDPKVTAIPASPTPDKEGEA